MAKKAAKKAATQAASKPAEELLGGTTPKPSAKKARPLGDLGLVTGLEASVAAAGFKTIDALVAWYAEGNEFDSIAHVSEGGARSIEAQLSKLVHGWQPRKDRAASWANAEISLVLADLEAKTVKIFQAREIVTLGDLVPTWQDKEGRAELVAIIDPNDVDYLDKYVASLDKQTTATPSFSESAVSSGAIAPTSSAPTNGTSSASSAIASPAKNKNKSIASTEPGRELVRIESSELGRLQHRDELLARVEKESIEVEKLLADYHKKKDASLAAKKAHDERAAKLLDLIKEANDPQQRLPFVPPVASEPELETGSDEPDVVDAGYTIERNGETVSVGMDATTIDTASKWRGEKVSAMMLGPKISTALLAAGIETLGSLADTIAADGLGKVKGLGKKGAAEALAAYERFVDQNVRGGYTEAANVTATSGNKPSAVKLLRTVRGMNEADGCVAGKTFAVKSWLGKNPIVTTGAGRDITLAPADWEAASGAS